MKRGAQGDLQYPKSTKTTKASSTQPRQMIVYPGGGIYPRLPPMGGGTNQQAMRTGGWANPARGGELKFVDVSVPALNIPTTAVWTTGQLLNGLVPGSAATERIGRKVTMKSFLIRYTISLASTTTFGSPFRILVVYDKQANATAPAITDILLADAFNAPNNLSNRDRFVTIFDRITEGLSVQGDFAMADVLFKRSNLEVMFNAGNAGTIGDITSGSVYLFACQTGSAASTAPVMIYRSRIRYTDV